MPKTKKLTELQEKALSLVLSNPFLSFAKKAEWQSDIPKMTKDQVAELIAILDEDKRDFTDYLVEYFKKNPDGGELIKGIKKLRSDARREIDSNAAEQVLISNLKNL